MPEKLLQPMNDLLSECGEAAVIHGIRASAGSSSRSFRYLAQCARNYVPPARPEGSRPKPSYQPDIIPQPLPPQPALPPILANHQPAPSRDPWATTLDELRRVYAASDWLAWLDESCLVAAGEAQDSAGKLVPIYHIRLASAGNVERLRNRALRLIRASLGTSLGRAFVLEIVAAEAEMEPTR